MHRLLRHVQLSGGEKARVMDVMSTFEQPGHL
jgi:hypothetical protein